MTPDVCFLVFAHVRYLNVWHMYVITYDFMVIVERCYVVAKTKINMDVTALRSKVIL